MSRRGTVHHWTLQLTLAEPFISMAMVAIAGAVVGSVLGNFQAGAVVPSAR
jgi:hypothetical protein